MTTPAAPTTSTPTMPAARIVMLNSAQQGREYEIEGGLRIGRAATNDIVIADPQASRHHATFSYEDGVYVVADAGSRNGVYVNGARVGRAGLCDGDIVAIGALKMAFRTGDAVLVAARGDYAGANRPPQAYDLHRITRLTIGRDPANTISLDHPQVSRHHAIIETSAVGSRVSDAGSTNGTFVNGSRINAPTPLRNGDTLTMGGFRLVVTHGVLYHAADEPTMRVDALRVNYAVGGRRLLHDVSLTIQPREFVVVIGASGSGKTTLMNVLSGASRPSSGLVLYNKNSRSDSDDPFVGYVPQEDIVPQSLSVRGAMRYAARLRLPLDTTSAEIEARVIETLDDLDLVAVADQSVRILSGGQRKRVSIGVELLAKPGLFFLDEPTSGLDPGLEAKMMGLLRKLADQGRSVIVATHATQSLAICDRLVVLAAGGRIAFCGTPDDALAYFGVDDFAHIYVKLTEEATPDEWVAHFQESPAFARGIAERLRGLHPDAAIAAQTGAGDLAFGRIEEALGSRRSTKASTTDTRRTARAALGQYHVLTTRYAESVWRDRSVLLALLFQAPIIALLLVLVYGAHVFDPQNGDLGQAKTLVFLLVLVAVWFGTANAAREIVKERDIVRRERRVGLRVLPYVLSKVTVLGGLCALQNGVLLAGVGAAVGWLARGLDTLLAMWLTLLLVALCGVALGLIISAFASSSDRALIFVPVALIPQIVFGGAVAILGDVGNAISTIIVTRWGYQALGTQANLNAVPPPPIRFSGLPPEFGSDIARLSNGSLRYANPDWLLLPDHSHEFAYAVTQHWLILLGIAAVTLGLTWLRLRRVR